jgi:glucose-6-phosphate 1-epimerase
VAIDPCAPQTLTAADGAQLITCAHGGHVLGWTPAAGRARLWLSPLAQCGPGAAIRGGIPVIFPQFADRGPLPKHGLARDRSWRVQPAEEKADGAARWSATLTDDQATRAIWPHRFELTVTARAEGDVLETALSVRNTDDVEWSFSAALHTYLALGDPSATIHGLGGRTAQDNAAGGQAIRLGIEGQALPATAKRDVAVPGLSGPLTLDDPALGQLVLTAEGFDDRVVWNPGAGHFLADVPNETEREFVCIEAAALTPVLINPGDVWTGRQWLKSIPL